MVQRRKSSKRWVWRLVFLMLLIAACVVCYLVWNSYFNNTKEGDSVGFDVNESRQEDINKPEVTIEEKPINDDDEKKVIQYEGDNPNTKNDLSRF